MKLSRREGRRTITTIVPLHHELARGTLRGALELAEIKEDEFMDVIRQ